MKPSDSLIDDCGTVNWYIKKDGTMEFWLKDFDEPLSLNELYQQMLNIYVQRTITTH